MTARFADTKKTIILFGLIILFSGQGNTTRAEETVSIYRTTKHSTLPGADPVQATENPEKVQITPCAGDERFRFFDFWAGEWHVANAQG